MRAFAGGTKTKQILWGGTRESNIYFCVSGTEYCKSEWDWDWKIRPAQVSTPNWPLRTQNPWPLRTTNQPLRTPTMTFTKPTPQNLTHCSTPEAISPPHILISLHYAGTQQHPTSLIPKPLNPTAPEPLTLTTLNFWPPAAQNYSKFQPELLITSSNITQL